MISKSSKLFSVMVKGKSRKTDFKYNFQPFPFLRFNFKKITDRQFTHCFDWIVEPENKIVTFQLHNLIQDIHLNFYRSGVSSL